MTIIIVITIKRRIYTNNCMRISNNKHQVSCATHREDKGIHCSISHDLWGIEVPLVSQVIIRVISCW